MRPWTRSIFGEALWFFQQRFEALSNWLSSSTEPGAELSKMLRPDSITHGTAIKLRTTSPVFALPSSDHEPEDLDLDFCKPLTPWNHGEVIGLLYVGGIGGSIWLETNITWDLIGNIPEVHLTIWTMCGTLMLEEVKALAPILPLNVHS